MRYHKIGYASAKLKSIYPNNKFLICNTSFEEEANKKDFLPKVILRYEYNAFACVHVIQ